MTGPDASLSLILQVMLIQKAFDLVSPSRSFPSSRSRQVITPGVWEMWLQARLGPLQGGGLRDPGHRGRAPRIEFPWYTV